MNHGLGWQRLATTALPEADTSMNKSLTKVAAVFGAIALSVGVVSCTSNTEEPPAGSDGESSVDEIPTAGRDAAEAVEVNADVEALVPQALLDAGKIRIVTDPTYAPMDFTDENGDIVGLDSDIAIAAVNAMGLEIEWSTVTFDGILAGIEADRYDATFSSFSVTDERLEAVDMVSYFSSGSAIMVASGNPSEIASESDLCGKSIAVQSGTTQALEILPAIDETCDEPIDLMIRPAQDNANQALASGRADAVVADNALISYYAQLQPDAFEFIDGILLDPAPIGVAVPQKPEGETLTLAFEAAFQSIIDDGTYAKIFEAWELQDSMLDAPAINSTE